MSSDHSPAIKCMEASCILKQAQQWRRVLGEQISEQTQRQLNKLEFRAENLAGEAGFDAAMQGLSAQVPSCIEPYRVLVSAYIAEYTQVVDHYNSEGCNPSQSKSA